MNYRLALVLACLATPALAQSAALSPADEAAAFTAAGFSRQGDEWRKCEDPGTPSYSPGSIEPVGDLNGDGLPEVMVLEGGAFCFGNTGTSFVLVSKQADDTWQPMFEVIGIPNVLETKGVDGWPDIEVGGPGFCFGVWRWNGSEYVINRHEYQGIACLP